MKTYRKINPIERVGGEALDEIKIRVDYNKDTYCGKRGVYVYLTPVHRGEYFETCTMCASIYESGFKMLLRELGRKSQKVVDELSAKIETKADEIASLWDKMAFEEIGKVIRNAIA